MHLHMSADCVLTIRRSGMDWKITEPAILNLSDKDRNAALLQDAEINFEFLNYELKI